MREVDNDDDNKSNIMRLSNCLASQGWECLVYPLIMPVILI